MAQVPPLPSLRVIHLTFALTLLGCPTQVVTPNPREVLRAEHQKQAQAALEGFIQAEQSQDFVKLYSMLAGPLRERYTPERLKSDYLALVTLGFCEIIPQVFLNAETITNGAKGIAPLDNIAAAGLQLDLNLDAMDSSPTLVDFGTTGSAYLSLYRGQSAELVAGQARTLGTTEYRPLWEILRRERGESRRVAGDRAGRRGMPVRRRHRGHASQRRTDRRVALRIGLNARTPRRQRRH